MTRIVFYEKPGCGSNTRQKQMLREAGADLDVRNLLTQVWTRTSLLSFFGSKPVAEWFNINAPQVKSGAMNPTQMSADAAIDAMLAEPLLIRRPLIEFGALRECGFEWPSLLQRLGLVIDNDNDNDDNETGTATELEACKHKSSSHHCSSSTANEAGVV